MVTHLFRDFLESPSRYAAAQAHWRARFNQLAQAAGEDGQWIEVAHAYYGDGRSPHPQDGNPIFKVYSQVTGRSVAVVQSPPESEAVELASWFGSEDNPTTSEQLTISLSLSDETSEIAGQLAALWMTGFSTKSQVLQLSSQLGSSQ